MNTLERVKKWLARSLEISEESITPQSTLGDLYRRRPQAGSVEDHGHPTGSRIEGVSPDSLDLIELTMWFEEEFDIEFPDVGAEALTDQWLSGTITVQRIVDLIDGMDAG